MSLSIGLHVKAKLTGSTELAAKVGNRIYPVVAVEGVSGFPFVEFDTATGGPIYDKDGVAEDNHTITVNCVSTNYAEGLQIAEIVRAALELQPSNQQGYIVTECTFEGRTEDFIADWKAYTQTLTFAAITCNK